MEKPILILKKRADIDKNRVILPKEFVDKYGRYFSMEMYKDKLVIVPYREKM